jgi:protocatechuate 3,4-dioxygenase beta subunit
MRNQLLACLAAAIFAAASARVPEIPGTVRGTVTDPSGAVVPGAVVLLSGPRSARRVVTDDAGSFVAPELMPGHYAVRVRARGFARFERPGLVVTSGQVTEADAPLAIRPPRQAITITAASGLAR